MERIVLNLAGGRSHGASAARARAGRKAVGERRTAARNPRYANPPAPWAGGKQPETALRKTAFLNGFHDIRGASTLEGAIGLTLLVLGLVMPITGLIQKITVTDSFAQAARDAAMAVAVLEDAPASDADLQTVLCDAVKESLGRPTADCADEWVIQFQAYSAPSLLAATPPTPRTGGEVGGEDNDIVFVRIFFRDVPIWHSLFPDPAYANATPDAQGAKGPPVAVGFARNGRGSAGGTT